MNNPFKSLAIATGLTISAISGHAQSASATISGTPAGGGNFNYTIILNNTGSTPLNSFWYGWIQFLDDLPTAPTAAANSLGWANTLSGNSIMWQNSTGTALAPGNSGTFTFVDSSTPTEITSGISGESVAYVNGITFSQGTLGDSTGIFSPTLVAAPEPSTWSLMGAGLFALLLRATPAPRPLFGIRKK